MRKFKHIVVKAADFWSKSKTSQPRMPLWVFWLIATFLYFAVFTFVDFYDNPFSGFKGLLTLVCQAAVVGFAASGLIGCLCLNRWVFAICFPFLTLISSALAYYHLAFGIAMSAAVIELMFASAKATWTTVITWHLWVWLLGGLAVAGFLVYVRWRCVARTRRWWSWGLLWVFIIVLSNFLVVRWNNAVSQRMPYCFAYSFYEFLQNKKLENTVRTTFDNFPVAAGENRPTVVVVIGESLRADHLGINGYYRNTTPNLAREPNIVSFPRIHTDYVWTNQSVPHMLTRADSVYPNRGKTEASFISLFKRVGYESLWISNQNKSPSYSYFMEEADSLIMVSPGRSRLNFTPVYDFVMLPPTRSFLQSRSDDNCSAQLLVVHMMGSHWVYHISHPREFARYRPEVDSRILSELSTEQLNNSYDNTILATDSFLESVIGMLRNRNAILIFMSDHGESLGEDGLYLHASPTEYNTNPACFIWYSDSYAQAYPEKIAAMKQNAGKRWRNDVFFHTVVDAADLRTEVMDTTMSVMRLHR